MPIHETDLEENRFNSDQWKYYELWEKVEVRLRRRKALWLGLVVVIFLAISAVPVVLDQAPRWRGKAALRNLADELNRIKVEVIAEQKPIRLRFEGNHFRVTTVSSCLAVEEGVFLREGELLSGEKGELLTRVSHTAGVTLGIQSIQDEFCYHPTEGLIGNTSGEYMFAVIPKADWDLKDDRRISFLVLNDLIAEPVLD